MWSIKSNYKKGNATITVVNGAGSGSYNIGESCSIEATVPEGYAFKEWLSNDVGISSVLLVFSLFSGFSPGSRSSRRCCRTEA